MADPADRSPASAACRWCKPGDDLARDHARRLCRDRHLRPRTATCSSSRRRSSRRPRAGIVDVATVEPSPRGDRARRRGREGPAPCRGHPVGIAAHRAAPPEPDDRRAPARLCHGQCRHRPFQCRARTTAPSACCCCRSIPTRSAEALRGELAEPHRQADRGHRQRQFRAAVPPRHGRHRARRRRAAGGDRLARPARSVRPHARSHRDRLCRRDRRRRLAGAGPGRRGDADRAGARPVLVGARRARPPRWSARRSTICSDERDATARSSRCRAGSAAPSSRSASTASCRPTR